MLNMAGTERLQLEVSTDLKARVAAEADARGQSITTYVKRTLEAALPTTPESEPSLTTAASLRASEAAPSEAKGAPCVEQSGPAPVSSESASEDVRPAASPRTFKPQPKKGAKR